MSTTHISCNIDYKTYYQAEVLPRTNRIIANSDKIAAAQAAAVAAAETISAKPAFEQLPPDLVQQLRQDGTRGGLRSLKDAETLYNHLPDSLDSIQDVRDVVDSANYEGGHIISHHHGGSDTADNIVYMPTDLNRHLGDQTPTADELRQARTAVTNEGYLGDSPALEGIADLAAGATAPIAARLTGTGVRLLGGMVRNDQAAVNQAFTELPSQLAAGATEGLTRGVPAVIGGSVLGPVGAVGGMVAADFIEAAATDDDSVRFNKCMEGAAKATVAAALICNPPLAAIAGAGWLVGKFFNDRPDQLKDDHAQALESNGHYQDWGYTYAASAPISNAIGGEIGVVTKDEKTGTVQRTGFGFYLRSDHLCNKKYDLSKIDLSKLP